MKSFYYVLLLMFVIASAQAANTEKNFGGVGIDGISLPDGRIQVGQVVAGGPAQLAGIRHGDIITNIDGKQTKGNDFPVLVMKRLRGIAGTKVVLRVQRAGEEKLLTFTLVRRQLVMK